MRREELVNEADELIERLRKGMTVGTFSNQNPDAHVTVEEYDGFCRSIYTEIVKQFGEESKEKEAWDALNERLRENFEKNYASTPDDGQETYYLRAYVDDIRAYRNFIRTIFPATPRLNASSPPRDLETLYSRFRRRLENNPIFVLLTLVIAFIGSLLVLHEAYKAIFGS